MPGITVRRATVHDAGDIAFLVNALLQEVMRETHIASFNVDEERTKGQASQYIGAGNYVVFLAVSESESRPLGFLSVTECYALYAEGNFGIIPECYVRPEFRSQGIGEALLSAVKSLAKEQRWTRLEVTTPPLPTFQRTLRFYEKAGFKISGGRKLKVLI